MNTKAALFLITVSVIASSLSSCVVRRTAYEQEIAATPIVQAPLIADLDINPKTKVEATYMSLKNGLGAWDGTETQAKTAALYLAMDENGCDVIINPVYEITRISRKRVNVNVKGMCGKYTDIRKPNLEDVTLLQELEEAHPMFAPSTSVLVSNQSGIEVKRVATSSGGKNDSQNQDDKRKKRRRIIGGVLGGIAAIAVLLGILL
jgi:hypothetical protein